ncbi:unnamed protein product [Calypogeia fissa]
MGNTPLGCVSGAGGGGGGVDSEAVKKVKVLHPDGTIELLDGPMEAAELMIEHINHMVMHCSNSGWSVPNGERLSTTMTILQPHEKLQPGEAYVLHPIPSRGSNGKTKTRPQTFTVPVDLNLVSEVGAKQKNDGLKSSDIKNLEHDTKFCKQSKPRFLQRYQSRVADSFQSEVKMETPLLKSTGDGTLGRRFVEESMELQQKDGLMKDHGEKGEDKDDNEDGPIVLNLNMYTGWRPALESIPESPHGFHHPQDMMVQQPPLLCV